mmetsp:Transcript_31656/g.89939  ORF Transcript_31656/g.89939 Transcript_31656/m.89939 type:complete len:92 (+) Transcript_31656:2983-3258(+)
MEKLRPLLKPRDLGDFEMPSVPAASLLGCADFLGMEDLVSGVLNTILREMRAARQWINGPAEGSLPWDRPSALAWNHMTSFFKSANAASDG